MSEGDMSTAHEPAAGSATDVNGAKLAGPREWVGLGVLGLASLLVSIDVFVLLLALPSLSADLGATSTEQLWIMDVYSFLLAGFMITMGAVGDRVGRRKLLLIGATAFTAPSVIAAFSATPLLLILARAAMGIAGATLAPSTLSLISTMFPVARQRSLAIGVWLTCFMSGAVIGPLLGGIVLEHFWWGAVFLLGIPPMVLLLVIGPILLPEYRNDDAGRLNLASVALSLAAILPVVYGVKEIARAGWQAGPIAAIVVGAIAGFVFVRRERRLPEPLLDLTLFHNRQFNAALVGMHLITVTGALMLLIAQYLQLVRELDPFAAGLAMVPAILAGVMSMLFAPVLARRVRPATLIASGMAVSIVGLGLIAVATTGAELGWIIAGYAIWQLGCGPMVALGTDLVVGSVPPPRAGNAAALSETSSELGFAIGIAVIGSVVAAVYRLGVADTTASLDPADADLANDSVTGAAEVAGSLPAGPAGALLAAASDAWLVGMWFGIALIAIVMVAVAVLALTFLRGAGAYRVEPGSAASDDEAAVAGDPTAKTGATGAVPQGAAGQGQAVSPSG
ncbi:MFS transporter [Agromyces albus]|uniref:MFS transporter n=1 Tax=Agromyces albus TaxID=205332 RepID=UPI0027872A12|nr:MFS transporter [Agromyces albus]MDQ0576500.1 DHA2 family multidrug resistance protein-like MFS transporter [Agromyces albus]